MFTQEEIKLAKLTYEAIKKISKAKGKEWEWRPEKGDWFILNNEIFIVEKFGYLDIGNERIFRITYVRDFTHVRGYSEGFIEPPIQIASCDLRDAIFLPHWEKLIKVIEDLGFFVDVTRYYDDEREAFCHSCCIYSRMMILVSKEEKSLQEAVQKAIIELGEEIGK